jgi:hypothetical protein
VIEGWRNVVVRTAPAGPVKLLERVTAPAKPLVAAGLPRLVERIVAWCEPPELKLTLVELLARVNPLTLTGSIPEFLARRLVAA